MLHSSIIDYLKILDEKKKEEYVAKMYDIYHDFEMRSVGAESTQIMMKTVRCAVEDARLFGEEGFPSSEHDVSDGLLQTHPDATHQFDEPLSGRISRLFADSRAGAIHQLNNQSWGTIEKTLHKWIMEDVNIW